MVVAARPNFVKVAPILKAFATDPGTGAHVLHTGQHYDRLMSGSFLEQLGFPEAAYSLGVGSGTHAEQTAGVMIGVERVLAERTFDAVLVPGDVNSTMAAALAAAKAGVPVIHLEAGLRSGDRTMPEEINRVVTDRISDLLLCHSDEALDNLAAEGIAGPHVAMVGNTMIDSLFELLPTARTTGAVAKYELDEHRYALVTLHRPALVDFPDRLLAVLEVLADLADSLPVVLPLHPRTRQRLGKDAAPLLRRLRVLDPLEYLEFVHLQSAARLVITDSGGVQEETSALGVPCVTYRTSTERPVTITHGTNRLVGLEPEALREACADVFETPLPEAGSHVIPLWDGQAGPRAAEVITAFLGADRVTS